MQSIAGNNLYHQWFSDDLIISRFRTVASKSFTHFNCSDAEVLQVCWFYNLVKIKNSFYLIGFTNQEGNVRKITLPEECSPSNVTIVGNDYKLLIVDKYLSKIWIINLDNHADIKCMNLNIESPGEHSVKKKKLVDQIMKISLFNDSLLYLTESGNVYCGMLPSYVDTSHCMGKIIDVSCGYEHYVLLTDIGRVYTWGNGRRLQLGHGDESNLDIPTEVEALAGIKITKICTGGWHSLAISEFGDLYAWGWNDNGQLGIREYEKKSYPLPTIVDIFDGDTVYDKNVKDISCGSKFSAIILEDNSVWTTGSNKYGQLGLPTDLDSVTSFQKVYQCNDYFKLLCGPWTTVVIHK